MAFTAIGTRVRCEVALTMAATPKTITSLTRATSYINGGNATATSAAHGLTAGTIGVLTVPAGMVEADGQAIRVFGPAADTFVCQGLPNAGYGAFEGSATLLPVANWGLLDEAIGWEESGGEAKNLDDTRLLDQMERQISVGMTAQSVALTLRGQSYDSDAMAVLKLAADKGEAVVIRLVMQQAKGAAVHWGNFLPSYSTFGLQVGALGTSSMTLTPMGRVLNGKAA